MKTETKLERWINQEIGTVLLTTIRAQIWMGISLLAAYIIYSKNQDIGEALCVYFITLFLTFGMIYNYWYLFLGALYTGTRKLNNQVHGFCALLLPIVFFVTFPKSKKRLLRCYNIGQQWKGTRKQHIEARVEAAKTLLENKYQRKEDRLKRILKYAQARKKRAYMEMFVGVSRAIGDHIENIENHFHWDEEGHKLTQLFDRYQIASPYHKERIGCKYRHKMQPGYNPNELPEISPQQATIEGKLLYLAVLIRAEKDNHYNRLDFKRSDFKTGRYVYMSDRSAIDMGLWNRHLPAINAYLGGEWVVEPMDGTSLVLYQLAELPSLIPFQDNYLRDGEIFYGFNVRTGERYYNELDKFPHHLIVGQSGSGKSVFLNQVMASLIHNISHFEKIVLVDLKGGVELAKYEGLHSKIQLIDDYDDLPGLMQKIYEQMRERLHLMRQKGHTIFDGPHMCVIVDEYAQIQQFEPITKEEKEAHKLLLSYLNRISMLGRAARVTLWAQLQKATVDNISASFRNNLQTKICFKVHSNTDAATVFGNAADLPGISSLGGFKNLPKGRFILSDDVSGQDVYMQAAMLDDGFPLARLLQTADDARGVSEEQADEGMREAERAQRGRVSE